jgi:hypothetical protein
MTRLVFKFQHIVYDKVCIFLIKTVKCILVQTLRLCTDYTAHRGNRGIALLYRH